MKTSHLFLWAVALLVNWPVSAQSLAIRYDGAWTNLTFGSTGRAYVDVAVDVPNAVIKFDLDGFVFGSFNPPLITMPGVIESGVLHLDSKGVSGFGDIAGTVNLASGATLIDLTNIPNASIKHVQLSGTVGTRMDLQYTVDFNGPASPTNPARGVLAANSIAPLQITSSRVVNGQIEVQWTGGRPPYQVQTSGTLPATTWTNFQNATSSTNGTVPLGNAKQVFVRVMGQ